jgi:hypothetical protein
MNVLAYTRPATVTGFLEVAVMTAGDGRQLMDDQLRWKKLELVKLGPERERLEQTRDSIKEDIAEARRIRDHVAREITLEQLRSRLAAVSVDLATAAAREQALRRELEEDA